MLFRSPFEPMGISGDTMRLLDVFLLHCLLSDSPADSPAEIARIGNNQDLVAQHGRRPGLMLAGSCGDIALTDWAMQVLDDCVPIAQALDRAHGTSRYRAVLDSACNLVLDPGSTPSAVVLDCVQRVHHNSFHAFALQQSIAHRSALLANPLSRKKVAHYEQTALQSVERQHAIDTSEQEPFDSFVARYLAPESLGDYSN